MTGAVAALRTHTYAAPQAGLQDLVAATESEREPDRSPAQVDRWLAFVSGQGIHPKLALSSPGDPDEREADAVADRVMRMAEPGPVSRSVEQIHHKCAACAEDEEGVVARKTDAASASGVSDPQLGAAIGGLGSGTPLPVAERSFFEPRFGRDLSAVRIHNDAAGDRAARAIQARAFAVGSDIGFASGEYSPGNHGGRQLMAHELAHVVQEEASTGAQPSTIRRHPAPPCPPGLPISAGLPQIYLPANDAIAHAYMATHPGNEVLFGENFSRTLPKNAKASWATQFLSEFLGIKKQLQPDIIDFTDHAIYEVKTDGYAAKGAIQIVSYYKIAEAIQLAHSGEPGIGENWSSTSWFPPHSLPLLGSIGSFVCTQMTTHIGSLDGVILYSVLQNTGRPPIIVPMPQPVGQESDARQRVRPRVPVLRDPFQSPSPARGFDPTPIIAAVVVVALLALGGPALIAGIIRLGAALAALLGGASLAFGGPGGGGGGSSDSADGTGETQGKGEVGQGQSPTVNGVQGNGGQSGAESAQGSSGDNSNGRAAGSKSGTGGSSQKGTGTSDEGRDVANSGSKVEIDEAVRKLLEATRQLADPTGEQISAEDARKILELGLDFLQKLQKADPADPNAKKLKELTATMISLVERALKKNEGKASGETDTTEGDAKPVEKPSSPKEQDSKKSKAAGAGPEKGSSNQPKAAGGKGSKGSGGDSTSNGFKSESTFEFTPIGFDPGKAKAGEKFNIKVGIVKFGGRRVAINKNAIFDRFDRVSSISGIAYFHLDEDSYVDTDSDGVNDIVINKHIEVIFTRKQ